MSLKENLKVFAEKLESAKIKYAQISKRYSYWNDALCTISNCTICEYAYDI